MNIGLKTLLTSGETISVASTSPWLRRLLETESHEILGHGDRVSRHDVVGVSLKAGDVEVEEADCRILGVWPSGLGGARSFHYAFRQLTPIGCLEPYVHLAATAGTSHTTNGLPWSRTFQRVQSKWRDATLDGPGSMRPEQVVRSASEAFQEGSIDSDQLMQVVARALDSLSTEAKRARSRERGTCRMAVFPSSTTAPIVLHIDSTPVRALELAADLRRMQPGSSVEVYGPDGHFVGLFGRTSGLTQVLESLNEGESSFVCIRTIRTIRLGDETGGVEKVLQVLGESPRERASRARVIVDLLGPHSAFRLLDLA